MTTDWVHGAGHSPVCQILLQIVMKAVITSSPSDLELKNRSGEHCASVEQFADGERTCTFPSVHLPKILLLTVQFQILNLGARCLIHLAHCKCFVGNFS